MLSLPTRGSSSLAYIAMVWKCVRLTIPLGCTKSGPVVFTSGAMLAMPTSSAWRRQALKNEAENSASAIVYCEAISLLARAAIKLITWGSPYFCTVFRGNPG